MTMRILIVTDAWFPQVNGVVRTLDTITKELRAMGDEVHVISPQDHWTLPCPTYPEIRLSITTPFHLARKIEAIKPDAIQISTEGPLGWMARGYCMWKRYPFTTAYHTRFPEYIYSRFGIPEAITYAFLRCFHKRSVSMMVPTQTVVNTLEQRGFTHAKLWGRGVDTQLFRPGKAAPLKLKKPVWLSVGRLSVEKNLEAFLSAKVPGTKLVVGDGPLMNDLKQKFPDAVFVGTKQGKELVAHYNAADVFVFPSKSDTFGLVMLEALACGKPVAAYPVMGPIDVVTDPKAGCLHGDLATAMKRALKCKAADCRAFAEKQSWRASAERFRSLLVRMGNPS